MSGGDDTKQCKDCGEIKSLDEFRSNGQGGAKSYCVSCGRIRKRCGSPRRQGGSYTRAYYHRNQEKRRAAARAYYIEKKHGLTVSEYEAIIARGCAICGSHHGQINLDHDHRSGKIRDALCSPCNLLLGYANDDPERLVAAVDYLRSHSEETTREVAAMPTVMEADRGSYSGSSA